MLIDGLLLAIDHVAIAVKDLPASVAAYQRLLGARVVHEEVVEDQGVREVLLQAGESFIQLLHPLGPETTVARFLAKKGEGLHHVGYRVKSVEAAIEAARAAGMRLIDEKPRKGSRGTRIAFVHPSALGGTLIELVEEGTESHG